MMSIPPIRTLLLRPHHHLHLRCNLHHRRRHRLRLLRHQGRCHLEAVGRCWIWFVFLLDLHIRPCILAVVPTLPDFPNRRSRKGCHPVGHRHRQVDRHRAVVRHCCGSLEQ